MLHPVHLYCLDCWTTVVCGTGWSTNALFVCVDFFSFFFLFSLGWGPACYLSTNLPASAYIVQGRSAVNVKIHIVSIHIYMGLWAYDGYPPIVWILRPQGQSSRSSWGLFLVPRQNLEPLSLFTYLHSVLYPKTNQAQFKGYSKILPLVILSVIRLACNLPAKE